jgi:hypothetical protein
MAARMTCRCAMAADGDHQRSQADERSDTGADSKHEA